MKRFVSLVFVLVSVFCYADSVQQGCVKTRGRMINGKHVPGQGLPGSIVSIKDRTAIGVKNSNGTFSFPVTDNHFRVDSVKKKDYVLLDADAASKTYTHTADTLFFVMETPEQILQDKLSTERLLRRSLQTKLQARENELDSLIAIQKISQEEYQQSLQKLYAEQSENDKLISNMAERYSTLDYDQMDEFYRQVSYYIEQCEFVKADSLLKTRGNIHVQLEAAKQQGQAIQQDEEKLQRAKVVHQHDIDELAKRCYSYFENFKMQYQNDSAAYYLEQRMQLDTTNVEWLDEYADFLKKYLAQYNRALEYYQQSLAIKKQVYGESHPDVALSYNNIGSLYREKSMYNEAMEYYKKALCVYERMFPKHHYIFAILYNNLATTYKSLSQFQKSLDYFLKSLSIRKKIYGDNSIEVGILCNNLGDLYSCMMEYEKSIEYYTQALIILKEQIGEHHPVIATLYSNISTIYNNHYKDYNKALDYLRKAMEIDIKVYGEEHSYIAINYNNLGRVYNSMKEYKESLKYYEKSLTILKKVYGDNHERIAMSYCNIGEANVKLENYEQALLYYNQAYEMFIKLLGEEHYTIAVVYLGYGDLYLSQKKYLEALRYLEKSSDLYIKLFNDKYKSLTTVYEKMALCYEGLGDLEKANEYRNKMHL